jgi:glucosamine-6-phosphate deaminase
MEVIVQPDAVAVAQLAARIFERQLQRKPASVLGLATGSTPLGLYRELIGLHGAGRIDFSRARSFNLDEYLGLAPDHPQSYAHFMRENLFQHVNFAAGATHLPSGLAQDFEAEAARYENAIRRAGGIDLQLLGVGANGHIGFNEPSSSLTSRTRIKTLAPQTIEDNARFFGDRAHVPRHVITMGIGTIMEARHCLVLAIGAAKAEAVAQMVEGPISANWPASALQMHPSCTLITDEAAAKSLHRVDYYRWVYDNKPDWQKL